MLCCCTAQNVQGSVWLSWWVINYLAISKKFCSCLQTLLLNKGAYVNLSPLWGPNVAQFAKKASVCSHNSRTVKENEILDTKWVWKLYCAEWCFFFCFALRACASFGLIPSCSCFSSLGWIIWDSFFFLPWRMWTTFQPGCFP